MPLPSCHVCTTSRAEVKRPRTGHLLCKNCFFHEIEEEVHHCITSERMFQPGEIVVSGASGGKDSTVLLHILTLLNKRHSYNIDIRLLSIDEGIDGYRDDSISTVKENAKTYQLPLHILSYRDLFGWTMDEIVRRVGVRNSCTYCGVLRRQALERGATQISATVIATGHNADDNAETVLMNVLRADLPRLAQNATATTLTFPNTESRNGTMSDTMDHKGSSSVAPHTAHHGSKSDMSNSMEEVAHSSCPPTALRRVKPLKSIYQKDIVLYARYKHLVYFTTECTYAREAFRGTVRDLLKRLEVIHPQCIAQIVHSAESLPFQQNTISTSRSKSSSSDIPVVGSSEDEKGRLQACLCCGAATTQPRCRACLLLYSLEHSNDHDTSKSCHSENKRKKEENDEQSVPPPLLHQNVGKENDKRNEVVQGQHLPFTSESIPSTVGTDDSKKDLFHRLL